MGHLPPDRRAAGPVNTPNSCPKLGMPVEIDLALDVDLLGDGTAAPSRR